MAAGGFVARSGFELFCPAPPCSLQRLRQKDRFAGAGLEGVALETGGGVGPQGPVIVVEDLQREFAAAELACLGFDGGKQGASSAATAVRRENGYIVQVHERSGGEGRKAQKTYGHAHGVIAVIGEKNERRGMGSQARDEAFARVGGKGSTVTHRVA